MHRKLKKRGLSFAFTIIINVLLLIVVLVLMSYVQRLLFSDVRISLTEIVTQNKNLISSKIQLEVQNLGNISQQISERIDIKDNSSDQSVEQIFLDYAERTKDPMLCWANTKGDAIYGDGQRVSIAGRKYFQLALEGRSNISERTLSRLTAEDIFVISVPLRYGDEIIGTIQKQYTPEEMYQICSVSLFSERGSMYIINSDGYILINSSQGAQYTDSSNYYRMLFSSNKENSIRMEEDIRAGKSGFMETTMDGEKVFSAYTPIEHVHDWYLITSIKTDAIISNSNNAIKLMYGALIVFVLSLTASMLYQFTLKNRQQKHLEHIAFVDTVTGGNTYAKFIMDVQTLFAIQGTATSYIITFDVDGFKYINRFYGFELGDSILKKVYEHCASLLLPTECIARTSSDHFVLALKDISLERLNRMFCSDLTFDKIKIYLSTGLYPVTDTSESLNLMVDKANLARQVAKGRRIKRVEVYSQNSDEELAKNEQMKSGVEQALENDEIVPFFQPKVDVNTNKLVGAEALARWITKEGKMIFPNDFIPVCEETGLISLVDWRIFECTLAFIRSCLDKGIACVPISVNFSRINLLNEHFSDSLQEALRKYQVPAHLIEVELTETVIFDNVETINAFIDQLHDIGLTISMDDFGLGYSSLQMLKDINIDVLKIDKTFLQATSNSSRQKVVFETIIQMANRLHIKTVVEGVETIENIELMRSADSHIAQGYYYSKPVAADTFEKYYAEGKI